MACKCKICKQGKIDEAWYRSLPKSKRKHAMDVLARLNASEMDCDYYHAIIDGSWPEADLIIAGKRNAAQKEGGE
jgi:hypothetical protein